MSVYYSLDGGEPNDLASNTGHGDLCRWIDTLDADAPELAHLRHHGWSDDLAALEAELAAALLAQSPTSADTLRTARGLLSALRNRHEAEVLTINNGIVSSEDDAPVEESFTPTEWYAALTEAEARSVGDVWQGASGKWFTKRQDGKVVPARNPNAQDRTAAPQQRKAAEPKPPRPSAEEKAAAKAAQTDAAHKGILDRKASGKVSAKEMHTLAGELLTLTHAQLDELKKRLGLRAGGNKYRKASKMAALALSRADAKLKRKGGNKPWEANNGKTDGPGGGSPPGGPPAASGPVAGETGGPAGRGADQGRDAGGQPAGGRTARGVPATEDEIKKRLDRFGKFFESRGQGHVSAWLGRLKGHIEAVGGAQALAALGGAPTVPGDKSEVQYWGVGTEEANWKNMGSFIESYLSRNGITAVTGDTSSPDSPLISALGKPDRYIAGQDFKPENDAFQNKLDEAQHLPGLEKSEDVSKLVGKPVTHLTSEVIGKLDETYGAGKWIVKCYDDNAAAGYGIFFPQRAAAIAQDARNTIWDAGANLAKYGFSLQRDDGGKVIGLKHAGGDRYDFGSEKYEKTIDGDARHWADRAAAASHHEKGAMLPEGSFMAQPAFEAVGISDAERAAGKTWHEKNEGRVHLVVRNGKAEVIPHATWLKGGDLPVVFEDDDTRAMARAAQNAIDALPEKARRGQVYAPDVMKTKDGYKVVELNAQGDHNGSGYLHDNHFTIDAYVSHLAGREPAHVSFIRKLLTTHKRGD